MKPKSSTNWTLAEAAHLLNRAGFGGSPDAIRALHQQGLVAAVDSLLDPPGHDPAALPPPKWANAEAYAESVREFMKMRSQLGPPGGKGPKGGTGKASRPKQDAGGNEEMDEASPKMDEAGPRMDQSDRRAAQARLEAFKKLRQMSEGQGIELVRWWTNRMIVGTHPFQEKLTLFWHGHFATAMDKVKAAYFMYLQNQTFRTKGLGSLADLTKAIVRDPAMMIYLDLQGSRKQMPNENFAREVMELFLLGEGHYSEDDIKEAARAFTGLRLNRLTGTSSFLRFQHDAGSKTIFGRTGKFGPDDVIDILLDQPSCPRFIATKLWRFFVNDAPTSDEVDQLAAVLREEDFHIGASLARLFRSEEFYNPKNIRAEIKAPLVFFVQLAKQLEMTSLPAPVVGTGLREMGQVPFMPPNVAGWPGGASWITTNTLFARYNAAGAITRVDDPEFQMAGLRKGDRLKNKPIAAKVAKRVSDRVRSDWPRPDYARIAPPALRAKPEVLVDHLLFRFFQQTPSPEDRRKFLDHATHVSEGGMTDVEVARLVHLMLSTPAYQLT